MCRELLCVAPEKLEWRRYEEPDLAPGQVRVRCDSAAAKTGSEMSFYLGYRNARGVYDPQLGVHVPAPGSDPYPRGVGNMYVGTVIDVTPDVCGVSVGDAVFGHSHFRETVTIRAEHCRKLPQGMSWQAAVCTDPAEFALAAVRDGNVRLGDAVALFGMGAIGLLAVQSARLCGADPVIAVEPLANRRAAALALGADLALDPGACDAGLEIRKATGGRGADVVIEYSGAWQALQHALRGVAFGGTVVAGAYPGPYGAGLDLGAEAHFNTPNIVFSRACSEPNRDHPRWDCGRISDTCLRLLAEGQLSAEEIVTPIVPFDDLLTEYPKLATDPGSNIKLGAQRTSQ